MVNPEVENILKKVKEYSSNLYKEDLHSIFLYGSQARGDAREDSDIDILVVLKSTMNPYHEIDRTSEFIADLCWDYDVVISCHFISLEKFDHQSTPFIRNVKKEGVLL